MESKGASWMFGVVFDAFGVDVTRAQKRGALQSAGVPGSAATCQDALRGAAVKVFQQNWGDVFLSEIPEKRSSGIGIVTKSERGMIRNR